MSTTEQLDYAATVLDPGELFCTSDGQYWHLLPSGRDEPTGGEFYRTPSGRVFQKEVTTQGKRT